MQSVLAVFDGSVFRPIEPISLAANTQVRIVIEPVPAEEAKPRSFLQTAKSLRLQGPSDWSKNIDEYLRG